MSQSSRTLKEYEYGELGKAQEQAAKLQDYSLWLAWMRSHFTYALAVRMAIQVGCKVPSRSFYLKMKRAAIRSKGEL
jgi:hypothetical protein